MKKYIMGIIIITVITLLSIAGCVYLDIFQHNALLKLNEAEQILQSGDYEAAEISAKKMKSYLEESDFILRMYISHEELDKMLASAARMSAYAKEETKNDFLAESQSIRQRLELVVAGEKVTIDNIL